MLLKDILFGQIDALQSTKKLAGYNSVAFTKAIVCIIERSNTPENPYCITIDTYDFLMGKFQVYGSINQIDFDEIYPGTTLFDIVDLDSPSGDTLTNETNHFEFKTFQEASNYVGWSY